jgi:uncharacterized protein (UPF0335 family)
MADQRLVSIVERNERLEDEKRALGSDIKDVYAEAKSAGYPVDALRQVIRERRMEAQKREEREVGMTLIRNALGDFANTPLGEAALS